MRITASNPVLAVHDLEVSGADDVDAFYRRAVAAGAEVRDAPHDKPWGMRELALRSPDGHRFMLGQPVKPVKPV